MQFMGGKFRIAARLTAAMLADSPDASGFVEPFIGGASMTPHLVRAFGRGYCSDVMPELPALYSAVAAGWDPPEIVTESDYATTRLLSPSDPLYAFAAYGCSFSGKRWGGYARGAIGRNYAAEARRGLLRMRAELAQCEFLPLNYRDCAVIPGAITYCDPPYAGTTGYVCTFDSQEFWAWARERAVYGALYVSEYSCPIPHVEILSLTRNLEMQSASRAQRIEKLFRILP